MITYMSINAVSNVLLFKYRDVDEKTNEYIDMIETCITDVFTWITLKIGNEIEIKFIQQKEFYVNY